MDRRIYGKRTDFFAFSNGLTDEIELTPFVGDKNVEIGKLYYFPMLARAFEITRIIEG